MCAGGSAGSGADGSSSGIAGVFFGVLHGLGTLASSLPARPLERVFLLLLCASTPPSRALPQPPPPPQPWPPSGVHLHRSDPPFGRWCIVSALSVCSVCRRREAAPAADAAARAAGRAAKAAGSMAAAWAAAEAAAWPPGWPVAAARAPVRASRTAVGSSRRAAADAACEAAAAVERRRWRPGRRLRGVWSRGGARGARRRRRAMPGGSRRSLQCMRDAGHEPFLWKKSGTMCMWISRVAGVSAVRACAFLTLPTFLRRVVCLLYCWCDTKKVL